MAKLNDPTILFNTTPSTFYPNQWLDASITGNGKTGLALTGAYANERILINHVGLKSGGYTGVLQDISDKFPQVRKLYADGKILDAEKLLENEFRKKNCKQSPDMPMPLCSLDLDFLNQGQISDYKRITNMESGEVLVTYAHGQTSIERGAFVGRTTDTIAYNVYKTGSQKINVNVSLAMLTDNLLSPSVKYEGGYIYFAAKEKAQEFGLVARIIISGGNVYHTEKGIAIKEVDEVTILAKPFVGGNRDAQFKALKTELQNIKNSYSKLQSANEAIHKRLFNEATLSLKTNEDDKDISELIKRAAGGTLSESLLVRTWNFAKFITVCGCTEHTMTPAGLWATEPNDENAVLSFDNAAQLLYSTITNSMDSDNLLQLVNFFEKYAADLKKNAARVYGAQGYFIPNLTSPDSCVFGDVTAKTIHFIASSALAANLIYNHFLTTADQKTLKSKIFPFMKEVFNFYSDFIKLDSNGFYSTVPSYSPHSTPGNTIMGKPLQDFSLATNSTIDFLAFETLLDNLIHASEILATKDDVVVWQEMKTKLPQFSVNEKGELKEYTNSAFIDGQVNRGNMHCYGLYPLKNFVFKDKVVPYKPSVSTTSENVISLKTASVNAAIARLRAAGQVQDSKTTAMYAIQFANAGASEQVRELLLRLVSSCFTQSGVCLSNDWRGSGYTKHGKPSIDISGNLGFATAITESIIQSDRANIRLLPITLDELASGEITGICTDFGAIASMSWDTKAGRLSLKLNPKLTCKISIHVNQVFKKLKGKDLKLDASNVIHDVQLTAGKPVTIDIG